MNDVLEDERRILCDVLDQWEVRWSWTGDAEDQWDAGMWSRDWAQPITGGGCCEGCWGGPGPVMPANQRAAATSDAGPWHWHVWGLGGACEAEMTGPMILEKMLWQTLSFTYFQAVSSCFFYLSRRHHMCCARVSGISQWDVTTSPHSRAGDYDHMWRADIIQWWPGCGNILCRIQPRTRRGGEHVSFTYFSTLTN